MKSRIPTLMLIGALGCVQPVYAQTDKDKTDEDMTTFEMVQQETEDLMQTIGSYTADKKDEAVEAAQESMNKIDQRLDALEAEVDQHFDQMSDAAREEARESMKMLRDKRNQLAEWYGSMKASSADSWENMKDGFAGAYQDLAQAWEETAKEFNSNDGSNEQTQ